MAAKSILSSAEALNESTKKQFNGDTKPEPFNLTEWLSNEVKLPQYCDIFLEQGFQFPSQCCEINETVLDLLGIEKIGHRKRILVSCQKLAARCGLSSGLSNDIGSGTSPKTSDVEVKGQQCLDDVINQSSNDEAPPALPPKKGKASKPAPPFRVPLVLSDESAAIEQEVFNESSALVENSDISTVNDMDSVSLLERGSTPVEKETSAELTDKTGNLPIGLPPGSTLLDYEPIWEASEGKHEILNPEILNLVDTKEESCNSRGMPGIGDILESVDITPIESPSLNKPPSLTEPPPPIPPRADLDDKNDSVCASVPSHLTYEIPWQITGNNTAESKPNPQLEYAVQKPEEQQVIPAKKVAPKKPPRRNKPISMLLQPGSLTQDQEKNDKCIGGFSESSVVHSKRDEMEVLTIEKQVPSLNEEKEHVFDDTQRIKKKTEDISPNDGSIYGNAEEIKKSSRKPLLSFDKESSLPRKPIPAPRSKSLSGSEIQKPSLRATESAPDAGGEGGSCTEDDLSGSEEELGNNNKQNDVVSTYETVEMMPRASVYQTVQMPRASIYQVQQFFKEGYLFKQGGQQNNKGWKKRWVVFDGDELSYYKDQEHTDESLQVVSVSSMTEVNVVTEDTKRARFDLTCAGRTYMFALNPDEMTVIQVWASILMLAIITWKKENLDAAGSNPGGDMCEPDKQGYLKKQGNNVLADWKKRYIAIKEDKFSYYHNYEDFRNGNPINTLQMNLASVKLDPKSQSRFQLVTPYRTYLFQCDDDNELRSWISALEKAIQLALSDKTVINKIWENPSNRYCADCGRKDPVWASVNLVVCVCEHCIGVHRNLGVHTSKPRSLLMDQKIWKPSLIKLMVDVGNHVSNRFWKFRFPEDDQIDPDCTSEVREEFIRNKYVEKKYRHVTSLYGDSIALGEALRKVVVTDDVEETMQYLFCGADVKYVPADGTDTRTPYELAKDANQELQMEFLLQNGGNTEKVVKPEPVASPTSESIYEEPDMFHDKDYDLPSFPSNEQLSYEKEGYLQKKAPNAAVWRRRLFTLRGRELKYDKGDKDDVGVIKLKDVMEYVYNETVTLDIVTKDRTYNLRADTREEARSWYTVLRNKQVFQIPLVHQELGSDGIPHLVAKCLQFVESHGMDAEGIYRKNGNKAKIKHLKRLFDQDAESVILSREEYEVHDVAGLLKEYFRELPDPLMTEDAYAHFITASLLPDHNAKLYKYKESLARLPEVNRTTLKTVIGHLKSVSLQSTQNLMKLENISLIFGPTLMSNKQTGGMDTNTINKEFTVIGDFINFYKWLFDVGEDEEKKEQDIKDAIEKMIALQDIQNSQHVVDKLTLDIYSLDRMQESSRITVYSYAKASEICKELICKRALPPDANWGLFQVVNEEQERPFPATEKVLATILETGKYSQLSKDSYLIVKENYVCRIMATYGFQDEIKLVAANILQTMLIKGAKKKDSWKKMYITLEKGNLSVHKNARTRDVIDSWPVNETTLYIGIDKDKKPNTKFGFTIVRSTKDGQFIYRYICFDDEREQYRWISIFLKLKYPVGNMWVDPDLEPIGVYAEAMIPYSLPTPPKKQKPGSRLATAVSTIVMNELRMKQQSFKK